MTIRDEIIEMHTAHPTWTAQQIARVVDCSPIYVRSVKSRMKMGQLVKADVVATGQIERQIMAEIRKGRPLTYGDLETRTGLATKQLSMPVRRLKASGKIAVTHISLGNEKVAIMERPA